MLPSVLHSFQKFSCSFFFFFFADFWGVVSSSCLLLASRVLPLCERLLSISPGVLASSICPENFDHQHQQGSTASQFSYAILLMTSLHLSLPWLSSKLLDSSSPLMPVSGVREKATKMEGDTLIPLLETNGIIHFATFFKVSFLPPRIEVVVTVPSVKEQIRRPTLSSTPSYLRPGSGLSQACWAIQTYRFQKARSWGVHPPKRNCEGSQISQIDRFIAALPLLSQFQGASTLP